jgi:hypothetical protein
MKTGYIYGMKVKFTEKEIKKLHNKKIKKKLK